MSLCTFLERRWWFSYLLHTSTLSTWNTHTHTKLKLRMKFVLTPEVCGELPAVEGVTTKEGEHTAGSVIPAIHTLCLQLQLQLQWSVNHHLCQGCLRCKRGRVERVRLRSHIHIQSVCCLCLTNLQKTTRTTNIVIQCQLSHGPFTHHPAKLLRSHSTASCMLLE